MFTPTIFILVLFILSGCGTVKDRSYHYDEGRKDVNCGGSCLEKTFTHQFYSSEEELNRALGLNKGSASSHELTYYLGIVEFDDQGLYHHRNQRHEDFKWLRRLLSKEDAIVISYSHGWKHNARGDDGSNLPRFEAVLKQLVASENALTAEINKLRDQESKISPRIVIGLYTGWRGAIYESDFLNNLTFWNRKKTAQLVGHRDGKDYFSELNSVVSEAKKDGHRATRLVISGHSFGALLVHSAINGRVFDSLNTGSALNNEPLKVYGDQVVLINPAFEALDIGNLVLRSQELDYGVNQRPLYLLLSSETDDATGKWFRRGRYLSTFFRSYRNEKNEYYNNAEERRYADRTAIGSCKKYMPYRVSPTDNYIGVQFVNSDLPESPLYKELCSMWEQWRSAKNASDVTISMSLRTDAELLNKDAGTNLILAYEQTSPREADEKMDSLRKPNAVSPKTPFIFASIDSDILNGHGLENADIFWRFVSRMVVFGSAAQENLDKCSSYGFGNSKNRGDGAGYP